MFEEQVLGEKQNQTKPNAQKYSKELSFKQYYLEILIID